MSDLINIALNKKACQSSMSRWSKPDEAPLAVNGIKTGEFSFHTDLEPSAWWQVDFEAVYALAQVVVYNRSIKGSPMSERAKSMAVFISPDGMQWEKIYSGGEAFGGIQDRLPLVVDCKGKAARFVRLQLQEQNYLHLDQVEVYAPCDLPVTGRSLRELGQVYGTDKISHGFCAIYEQLFGTMQPRVTKMLEIGVFFGASLRMWRDWFPQAVIHGADHFTGQQGNGRFFEHADKFYQEVTSGRHPRIELHQLDQSKREDLVHFAAANQEATFDLVLDDASHLMRDQQLTLGLLFRLVKPGGYYVIEDLHSSNALDYDVEPDKSNSTLLMIQAALAGDGWHSRYMNAEEEAFLHDHLDLGASAIYSSGGSLTCALRRRMTPLKPYRAVIKPQRVVMINYATVDELNQVRQQQHIVWSRQWGTAALAVPSNGIDAFDVVCFGSDALDVQFTGENSQLLSQKRGGGYWIWKPYIIASMLAATDAEYLIYCDCGSTFLKPLTEIIQVMRETGSAILAFDMTSLGRRESDWTKGEVLRTLKAEDAYYTDTGQISAAVSVWRVCEESREFARLWLDLACHPPFVNDAPSADGMGDWPGFREHRHDQSLFSLLIKKALQFGSATGPLAVTRDFREWIGHHHITRRVVPAA